MLPVPARSLEHATELSDLAGIPAISASCVPPREPDIENVVEEGIAWTK